VGSTCQRKQFGGSFRAGLLGCCPGPAQSCWVVFFCSDSFFLFVFCFASYILYFGSKLIQTKFVIVVKIQSVKARQSGTSFQNKIRFSIKPYEF
jgi:hypothetical protein